MQILHHSAETSTDGKSDAERLAIDFDIASVKALVAPPCAYRARRAYPAAAGCWLLAYKA